LSFAVLVVALAPPPAWSQGGDDPVLADRLVIRFKNNQYELISRTPVTKVLPDAEALPAGGVRLRGFWYELQNSTGAVSYRRTIPDPVPIVFEGPNPDDPEGGLERIEVIPEERVFSILTPRCALGDQVVLFSSPRIAVDTRAPARAAMDDAAREVARITVVAPGAP
jgi:hypothetical protein